MEPTGQKNLERIISQRALQMGNSFPCQICVVGFLCGVCLTYFFLAILTSSGSLEIRGVSVLSSLEGISSENFTLEAMSADKGRSSDHNSMPKETERRRNSQENDEWSNRERVSLLYSCWTAMLNESEDGAGELFRKVGLSRSSVPKAPHLENCKLSTEVYGHLDNRRQENENFSSWTNWEGLFSRKTDGRTSSVDKEQQHFNHQAKSEDSNPPWIVGSDEDNFPLTRKVQRDLWIHQHPSNCSDPHVRFLIADWETLPGFGLGAQLAGMCGVLAIAVNEHRVLVTNYFNRADHDGCKGSLRSRWSCYFSPETSIQCRDRALELMTRHRSWEDGIITGNNNYTSKEIWAGRIPRMWGDPWSYLQPTTEIKGSLLTHHRKMDRRWWRAQGKTCDYAKTFRKFSMKSYPIWSEMDLRPPLLLLQPNLTLSPDQYACEKSQRNSSLSLTLLESSAHYNRYMC
ncbi:hypothetical protein GIB67_037641 [Kingdonia uniflora]|uniref:Uncharacterized protein n=1 Tax=Kingdonia uniflora TaxID=39325 RepID=A0A7J7LSS5_9MAGN|nr:hypothetical protein GIB67_037641 [Kingdonia uniflora]